MGRVWRRDLPRSKMPTLPIVHLLMLMLHACCGFLATPSLSGRGRRAVGMPPRACADGGFESLLSEIVLATSDSEREQRVEQRVRSWPAEQLKAKADALSDAIQARVVSVQTAAISEHERGGDTTKAQTELRALVDMMVYSKILIRQVKIETGQFETGQFKIET